MSKEAKKTTIYDELIDTFKIHKYQVDVNNNIFIEKVIDDVVHQREELMKLILGNTTLKNVFFKKIEDAFVFNPKALIEVLSAENKYLESRTTYSQSIGLTKKDDFIKTNDDVVLSFPFKDTVFIGGQDKEDEKTNENFLQEIINSNEIRRLFEPKVMSNIKRYSKDKVESNPTITEDDNLIIKGNNLLALHSLLDRADGEALYRGKVKLIYIDPPYNTGNDSFKYNDSFTHTTWLTFMKNRLEIAKEFLSDDGIITIHLDDNESHYLKVLMDEVFNREYFINSISIRDSHPSGLKITHKNKTIIKTKSQILCYSKSNNIFLNPLYQIREDWDTHFNIFIDINSEKKERHSLSHYIKQNSITEKNFTLNKNALKNKKFRDFCFKNRNSIFQSTKEIPKSAKELSLQNIDKVIEYDGSNNTRQFALNGRRLSPLSRSIWNVGFDGYKKEDFGKLLCDFWDDIDFNNSQNEGGVSLSSGKKPEYLLARIISLFSNKNDLVMDYHLGSGTTCAVAHKMGRRYIGIEQMDYIEDIAVERMKKVIEGEEGGISKAVEWQGGGEFVYMELKELDDYKGTELENEMKYLPIEEIEDETYNISKEDQEANFAFYGIDTKRD